MDITKMSSNSNIIYIIIQMSSILSDKFHMAVSQR